MVDAARPGKMGGTSLHFLHNQYTVVLYTCDKPSPGLLQASGSDDAGTLSDDRLSISGRPLLRHWAYHIARLYFDTGKSRSYLFCEHGRLGIGSAHPHGAVETIGRRQSNHPDSCATPADLLFFFASFGQDMSQIHFFTKKTIKRSGLDGQHTFQSVSDIDSIFPPIHSPVQNPPVNV